MTLNRHKGGFLSRYAFGEKKIGYFTTFGNRLYNTMSRTDTQFITQTQGWVFFWI